MEQFESLFKQVSLLVQQEKDEIRARMLRGEQFNIFKVCGIDHYELQHSAIISELLNPQGSHGQGKLYLKLFMQVYGSKLPIDEIEYDKVRVRTEKWTEAYDGRMDICVEYDGLPFVIIENKLYAKDQSIQLKKYKEDSDKIIKKSQYPKQKYEIVYLTLDGKDATKESGESVDYIRMSYSYDIIKWLNLCIDNSARIPLVRETLVQYQNHIKHLTNQDFYMTKQEELFKILENHPLEVDEIIRCANSDYFDYLFEKHLKPKLLQYAYNKGLEYEEPLWFSSRKWHNVKIGIDTNYTGCCSGVVYETEKEYQTKIWEYGPTHLWPFGWTKKNNIFYRWREPSLLCKILDNSLFDAIVKTIDELMDDLAKNGIDLSKPIKDYQS